MNNEFDDEILRNIYIEKSGENGNEESQLPILLLGIYLIINFSN